MSAAKSNTDEAIETMIHIDGASPFQRLENGIIGITAVGDAIEGGWGDAGLHAARVTLAAYMLEDVRQLARAQSPGQWKCHKNHTGAKDRRMNMETNQPTPFARDIFESRPTDTRILRRLESGGVLTASERKMIERQKQGSENTLVHFFAGVRGLGEVISQASHTDGDGLDESTAADLGMLLTMLGEIGDCASTAYVESTYLLNNSAVNEAAKSGEKK